MMSFLDSYNVNSSQQMQKKPARDQNPPTEMEPPYIKIGGLEARKTKEWLRVPDVSCYKWSFTVGSTPWNH